jgi:glyoxylase-like metal-dependent hydrolase (beta-lactamase superfamily II)
MRATPVAEPVRVSDRTELVLAPNPSPMTLEGTNTWVLAEPGATRSIVIDPGPDHAGHLDSVATAVGASDRVVGLVLLTHGHPDHAAGAKTFADKVSAPVRALDPRHRLGSEGLGDGDVVELDGLELRVVTTPGHSADSVCFTLPAENAVLTGDHVLGRGTTVVAHPDGRMGDYLDSLRRVAALGATRLLPGHGPVVDDPEAWLRYYLDHRAEREAQVVAALAAGATTIGDVVEVVYADVDRRLHAAAALSVAAQLELLVETGRVNVSDGDRFALR